MSAAAFFDAAKAFKRELLRNDSIGLTQADVDALNKVIDGWVIPVRALGDPANFFGAIRDHLGHLEQAQVDGFNRLLSAIASAGWPSAFAAYGLATAWHETAGKMEPVEEAFWKDDAWRRRNLTYYPWHGRGDVQLTWERNYRRADDELGLGGRLLANPRLALDPDISARVLVKGMEQGWFTAKKLADYLPKNGPADHRQFQLARYIINGQDKASAIADLALKMQTALSLGGWA